jgi:hypothetical protein
VPAKIFELIFEPKTTSPGPTAASSTPSNAPVFTEKPPREDPSVTGSCSDLNARKNSSGVIDQNGVPHPGKWGITTWEAFANNVPFDQLDSRTVQLFDRVVGNSYVVAVPLEFTAHAEVSTLAWSNPSTGLEQQWRDFKTFVDSHEKKHIAIVREQLALLQKRWDAHIFSAKANDSARKQIVEQAIQKAYKDDTHTFKKSIQDSSDQLDIAEQRGDFPCSRPGWTGQITFSFHLQPLPDCPIPFSPSPGPASCTLPLSWTQTEDYSYVWTLRTYNPSQKEPPNAWTQQADRRIIIRTTLVKRGFCSSGPAGGTWTDTDVSKVDSSAVDILSISRSSGNVLIRANVPAQEWEYYSVSEGCGNPPVTSAIWRASGNPLTLALSIPVSPKQEIVKGNYTPPGEALTHQFSSNSPNGKTITQNSLSWDLVAPDEPH